MKATLSPMNFHWDTPVAPMRTVSVDGPDPKPNRWRSAIGLLLAALLGLSVLFTVFTLFSYIHREGALYEELTDYLDKTVSVSKINYNPVLGQYQPSDAEMESLGEQRKYKALLYAFMITDACSLFFILMSILLFYTTDMQERTMHIWFWVFVSVSVLYTIGDTTTFSFFLYPYSQSLPNSTEFLLDRAVPFNPSGVLQMEARLGCTFDQNLYNAFQRRANPKNTCDPQIVSSFLSDSMLVAFVVMRVFALIVFLFLIARRRPFGEPVANLIRVTKPKGGYKAKYIKSPGAKRNLDKSTTFGIGEKRIPVISSPLPTLDHTLSYNNAAYFAVAGAKRINSAASSRCSDVSGLDIYNRDSLHTQNSITSEV